MADPEIKSPSEYAVLPAGTEVRYGQKGATIGTAALLQSAMAIGATGKKGTFMEVTRLIDTEPKYMADMGEGEDKTFVFIDDPSDTVQEALLSDAAAKKTVVFFIKFPNKRISEVELVLADWSLQSVDTPKGKVLQVEVYGKQNSIKWSVEQPVGGGK
ncbi:MULTISPECIES: phage tail protein [Klebsiella]|mgnify:FL=1|uniref:phage tail protein n=1 Tax=Klebsiella TaxID=570 RepID=UPI000C99F32E|nr:MULTISPECIES: phage tail protein [Klebsiella]ELH4094457.1 phage tail protein [Klebsiella oxytoca]MBG2643711.1 phage tail protein [Klebsiella michiganensis]MBZ7251328.1 phage tail protein [Klebsiella oxytoca]HCQ7058010.1 phage tail protein [Klebsiella oxytoca]HCQ7125102.1 phage tail protein [Klebsiella oxytoca]